MAMVALFRPGPMANIPSYIRRKHRQEPITYLHPLMQTVLADTYGVMVYQEDVMAVCQAVAGYTLAQADVLCYAIRKKIRDKLEAQQERFIAGARAQGVPKRVADQIWEQFEPFARYGFNRAHAACYGLIAYQTAYLKANYPAEYMAALLTTEAGGQDWMAKVAGAVAECQRMGVRVLPPDVNESVDTFTVVGGAIRFGLAAVKHVGGGAVDAILRARTEGGPFQALADLAARADARVVNKRVLESLIKAGAFDSLGRPRAVLLQEIDAALAVGQRASRTRAEAQTGLFDLGAAPPEPAAPVTTEEFSKAELLALERDMLGMYISDHPLSEAQAALAERVTTTIAALAESRDRAEVTIGGLITSLKRTTTKTGSVMAFMTLEDRSDAVEVIVFPKTYEAGHLALKRDAIVVVRGRVDVADQQVKVLAESVTPLADAPPVRRPRTVAADAALHVVVDADRHGEGGLELLRALLGRHPGDRPVVLTVRSAGREVRMQAGGLRVTADPSVVHEIEGLLGPRTASWLPDPS
jgi:DNA polymerase-3 subunit alpha